MPKIQIKFENGKIESVEGLTPEIVMEVFDYDVEKYGSKNLSADENGRVCKVKEWHAPE
jgi:hypothetical protein